MELVGEFLKKTRIKKDITLNTVSKCLKISIGYLKSIEDDNFALTPGGVYTIGYIRTYSNFLDLDSDEIIKQYKTQISFSEKEKPIELPKPIEAFQPLRFYKLASFIVVIPIIISFYFFFIQNSKLFPEYSITPEISESFLSEIEEFDLKNGLLELKGTSKEIALIQKDINSIQPVNNGVGNNIQKNKINVIASTKQDITSYEIENLISIEAIDSSWIQIRNQNNEIIFNKLLNPNDSYEYSILDNYEITTGNAGNLIVYIGGKIVGKLGKKGEVIDSLLISADYFLN